MTDPLNPPRKGTAADAAEGASESFTLELPPQMNVSVRSEKDRREAARKLAEWIDAESYLVWEHGDRTISYLDFLADKILEAMK